MRALSPGWATLAKSLAEMTVEAPWERVGIDLTGKHPRSRRVNYYVLTYIEYFTKWAEAYPIPNKESSTVCRLLVEEIFPRYGVPLQVISDQGREFDNRLVKGVCEIMGLIKYGPTHTRLQPTWL